MIIIRLYIQNFYCHDFSFIDFTQFNSAIIVGKIENNDLYSNGVGKTTIFSAIEYALFNQSDSNLEDIIREDSPSCSVTLDFLIDNQEYRIVRSRALPNISDLSLLKRISSTIPPHDFNNYPITDSQFKDLSCRRIADTEKELLKLIKTNFKSFRNTIHFAQNDFSGLTTATPSKRKELLKEALDLSVYSKLEKIAKNDSSSIHKQIEKHIAAIENLGSPLSEISQINTQISNITSKISSVSSDINLTNEEISSIKNNIDELKESLSKNLSLLEEQKLLIEKNNSLEISINENKSKKSATAQSAKDIVSSIKDLQTKKSSLEQQDLTDVFSDKITSIKEKIIYHNINIKNNLSKQKELSVPLPDGDVCSHCRQILTPEHKESCKLYTIQELNTCQSNISSSKNELITLNNELSLLQNSLTKLTETNNILQQISASVKSLTDSLDNKKILYQEYCSIINNYVTEYNTNLNRLSEIDNLLNQSAVNEVKSNIDSLKTKLAEKVTYLNSLNKELAHLSNNKAVLEHSLSQKENDHKKQTSLKMTLSDLENKHKVYAHVIQAFSSTGIPNLIIQNILDELQIEANNLLNQLKPGLQLYFKIEKTRTDGTQDDTLGISYTFNGRKRSYSQLSGAMQLIATFSLKLGLSFLLQKTTGADIKLLLLDEIDQSLDKAAVDALFDIIKFFQKDFTVLVITHNDRLKEKFSNVILVEQQIDGISRAKLHAV